MNRSAFPDPTNIQGVIVDLPRKHQRFGLFEIDDPGAANRWLRTAACDNVATADEVRRFNDLLTMLRDRRGGTKNRKATWMNLAISAAGLRKLGLSKNVLAGMDPAFQREAGQPAPWPDAQGAQSGPANWHEALGNKAIDLVIVVASDDPDDLQEQFDRYSADAEQNGLSALFVEPGEPGEHPRRPKLATCNDADLFVVNAAQTPPISPFDVRAQPAWQPAEAISRWHHEGAYLVFRKIGQRAPRSHARGASETTGRNGRGWQPAKQFGFRHRDDERLGAESSDTAITGTDCPLFRASTFEAGLDTADALNYESHIRVLRRGVARDTTYGDRVRRAGNDPTTADQGCVLEALQRGWANAPPGAGTLPRHTTRPSVVTRSTVYLFLPSITALRCIGA